MIPLAVANLNEMYEGVNARIRELSPPPVSAVSFSASSPLAPGGVGELARKFVPTLLDAAVNFVRVPLEQFTEAHKDFVRQYVSEAAIEAAIGVLRKLEDTPLPDAPGV